MMTAVLLLGTACAIASIVGFVSGGYIVLRACKRRQLDERTSITEWLRGIELSSEQPPPGSAERLVSDALRPLLDDLADSIERGDHLKPSKWLVRADNQGELN